MEIEYKGGIALTIKAGNVNLVINPKLSQLGLKDIKVTDAVEIVTEEDLKSEKEDQKLLIQGPGEYEVSNVSIKAVSVGKYGNQDEKTTAYSLNVGGSRIAILGHIASSLDEAQLEAIGVIDILILPVGGGDTLNAHDATKIVNQIDPKIVIPVNFSDKSVKYATEQEGIDVFLKELGANEHEVSDKLKIKNGIMPAVRTVYELRIN